MPWFPDSESGQFADIESDSVPDFAIGDFIERPNGLSKYKRGRITGFAPNGDARVNVGDGQSRIWRLDTLRKCQAPMPANGDNRPFADLLAEGLARADVTIRSDQARSVIIGSEEPKIGDRVSWTQAAIESRRIRARDHAPGIVQKIFRWQDSPTTVTIWFPERPRHRQSECVYLTDVKLFCPA